MKYTIHTEGGVPAYLQLYKQVREDIVQGIYPHNTKLPSKRIIADEVGISTVTVEHAYALLADEGYIEARERSGYFASFGGVQRQEKALPLVHSEDSLSDVPEDFPFSSLAP